MIDVSRVTTLIAGAGWRIQRFVLPALFLSGVTPARTIILRRSATHDGLPDGVRVITSLDQMGDIEIGLTLNCVTAESMLDVQRKLLAHFPAAIHFCDTPIRPPDDRSELPRSEGKLYSLEDWAALPNLHAFIEVARGAGSTCDLRLEHFGITGHFLAYLRQLCANLRVDMPIPERSEGGILATLRPGWRVLFRDQKQFPVAKVFCRTERRLVEDYFEVEPAAYENNEVLHRVIEGRSIRYCLGREVVGEYVLDSTMLERLKPWSNRKNVHELDKLVALTRIFGFIFGGSGVAPYSYAASASDAMMARALARA